MKDEELEDKYHNISAHILRSLGWSNSFRFNSPAKQSAIRSLFEDLAGVSGTTTTKDIKSYIDMVEDEVIHSMESTESGILYKIGLLRESLGEKD